MLSLLAVAVGRFAYAALGVVASRLDVEFNI